MYEFVIISMKGEKIATLKADRYDSYIPHVGWPGLYNEHLFSTKEERVARVCTPVGASVIRVDSIVDIEKPDA